MNQGLSYNVSKDIVEQYIEDQMKNSVEAKQSQTM